MEIVLVLNPTCLRVIKLNVWFLLINQQLCQQLFNQTNKLDVVFLLTFQINQSNKMKHSSFSLWIRQTWRNVLMPFKVNAGEVMSDEVFPFS